MDKKTKKLVIIGVVVLAVLVCAFLAIWFATRPETSKGAKTVNVTVDFGDGETKNYELHTDVEYLRGALDEENLVEGTESEFGLYVLTVDGVTADESKPAVVVLHQGRRDAHDGRGHDPDRRRRQL